jgi:hypothetical protein
MPRSWPPFYSPYAGIGKMTVLTKKADSQPWHKQGSLRPRKLHTGLNHIGSALSVKYERIMVLGGQ